MLADRRCLAADGQLHHHARVVWINPLDLRGEDRRRCSCLISSVNSQKPTHLGPTDQTRGSPADQTHTRHPVQTLAEKRKTFSPLATNRHSHLQPQDIRDFDQINKRVKKEDSRELKTRNDAPIVLSSSPVNKYSTSQF